MIVPSLVPNEDEQVMKMSPELRQSTPHLPQKHAATNLRYDADKVTDTPHRIPALSQKISSPFCTWLPITRCNGIANYHRPQLLMTHVETLHKPEPMFATLQRSQPAHQLRVGSLPRSPHSHSLRETIVSQSRSIRNGVLRKNTGGRRTPVRPCGRKDEAFAVFQWGERRAGAIV